MKVIGLMAALIALVLGGSASAGSALSWGGYTWHVHHGTNGAGQCQSPSHVWVSGGHLFEQVSNLCGGGVSMSHRDKHFGTWSITYRMTQGAGKYVILLWPQNGSRPEIDFAEDKPTDVARILTTGTYHPLPGCTNCQHVTTLGNFTQWHTVSVKWTSQGWALFKDGAQWANFKGSYSGNMHLAIQTAAWGSPGTSTLEVSSVKVS